VIGHYEFRKCLGEGGYGQVYEAWDRLLHRRVALKRLAIAHDDANREALISEARMAASLHHLAFVKIYGFEDDGRSQFIVMELVRGETLNSHAADCTANPRRALDIVDQVAAAMEEAHAAKLVHGDLKPGNLMIESSGTVRILDFGLARHIDPLATQSGVPEDPLGTISYMAPERLAGLRPSVASDIYALGVVLYQLVNGERPYAALHGLALASAHMHASSQQWQYPCNIDPGLLQLILALTARDPAVRLPTMHAVRAHIARVRGAPSGVAGAAAVPDALPEAAALPARPRQPQRERRIRPRPLLAGVVLAGGIAIAMLAGPQAWHAVSAPYSESAAMRAGMEALRHVDRDGQIERALDSFGAILVHTPGHAAASAGQSLAYSMRYSGDGRDEVWLMRAAAAAALAVHENDQLALAHTAQSWVAALQGQGAQALAAADRALALDPSDVLALSAKINVLLRMQRQDEAGALIARAESRWPKERVFTDLEGTLLYQRADYPGAERAFRRSLQLEPDGVLPYVNLSAALLRQARADEALAVLQHGLQVQPSGALYSNLGAALFDRGDYPGASTAFEHAISAANGGPNDYLKWANLADARRWIPGREQSAIDAYRRAMQLLRPMLARAPDDPTFLTRMGLYAARVGKASEALGWTERGVAAAPANPDVRFRAALANELSGRREAALAHLTRAVVLGFPFSTIESEPDLVALRRDARYQTLAMENKR
jgi:serine/threonine-protein kinase